MDQIVEFVEVGMHGANHYLDRGYVPMHVGIVSRWNKRPDGVYFNRHDFRYVMGRPKGVAHAERPPMREQRDHRFVTARVVPSAKEQQAMGVRTLADGPDYVR